MSHSWTYLRWQRDESRRGPVFPLLTDDHPSVLGTRRLTEAVAREPRVEATVIQTVGTKGYDGFLLARVR